MFQVSKNIIRGQSMVRTHTVERELTPESYSLATTCMLYGMKTYSHAHMHTQTNKMLTSDRSYNNAGYLSLDNFSVP